MTNAEESKGQLIWQLEEKSKLREELGDIEAFSDALEKCRKVLTSHLVELPSSTAFQEGVPSADLVEINGESHDVESTLTQLFDEILRFGLAANSGSHMGYIPGGGVPTAGIADLIAAITNEYSGMEYASPGAAGIENSAIKWLLDLFGFPEGAQGTLTSGGSIANLSGLIAARDFFRSKGHALEDITVLMSSQAHHSCAKALRIAGLAPSQTEELAIDQNCSIDLAANTEVIARLAEKGDPVLIVASAGTTNTGAIDPIDRLADLRDEHGWWLHVDAAYGGFFQLTEKGKQQLKGIDRADTLVVDPHKGLFLPYGLGAVLARRGKDLLRSFHHTATYLETAHQGDLYRNPADLSPELTRHFRGLRMWLPLRIHGIAPFVGSLEEKLLLARYAYMELAEKGFTMGPKPALSVCWFYHEIPGDLETQNKVNLRISELVNQRGRVFNSPSRLDGKVILRLAILSFRTDKRLVDLAIEDFTQAREKALAEM